MATADAAVSRNFPKPRGCTLALARQDVRHFLKIAQERTEYVHGSPARAAARAITAPSGGHASR